MIALDASAVIELLTRSDRAARIEALLDDDLVAPDLLIPEVLRFLARHDRDRAVAERRARALFDLDLDYVPIWPHGERIWELRVNLSPYDACYVTVAEVMGCPLLTTDRRLAAAPGLRVPVIAA